MKGKMRVMGPRGDTAVTWDTGVQSEVDAARKEFVDGVKSGMIAFEVAPETKEAKQIGDFNPNAEEIVLIPRVSGG